MASNDMQVFSTAEQLRYSRHLLIPEFGLQGQKKLKTSKVLVIGAGGLGSPVLLYLCAAGVGKIGIVDHDVIDDSNLQRQVLYETSQIGLEKATVARQKLEALNPHIQIQTYVEEMTSKNALELISGYDLVVDGSDNFPTRYLVNDACVILEKPLIYGSIFQFEGQVSVFNQLDESGVRGPNYRDLFPTPPPPGMVPSCAEGGVLGVLPGIIGSLQASEAIKVLTGIGETLSGRLFVFDALSFITTTLHIRRNPDTPAIKELIDYEVFCGIVKVPSGQDTPEISVQTLVTWRKEGRDFQLIDVRRPHELQIVAIGGSSIPLHTIIDEIDQVEMNKDVVFYCRSGQRSQQAIQQLLEVKPFTNLYNLKGGILAYIEEIDPSLTRY